jgi:hypothetical protein
MVEKVMILELVEKSGLWMVEKVMLRQLLVV